MNLRTKKYDKKLLLFVLFIMCFILFFDVMLSQNKKLDPADIERLRVQYPLYTNLNEGYEDSLINATEKVTKESFAYIQKRVGQKDGFAVIQGKILSDPVVNGNKIKFDIFCSKLAGYEELEDNVQLFTTKEVFWNYNEILKTGRSFVFICSGNYVARSFAWYLIEQDGRTYLLSVLNNEGIVEYDGIQLKDFVQLFSK